MTVLQLFLVFRMPHDSGILWLQASTNFQGFLNILNTITSLIIGVIIFDANFWV
jgi:hypothetical protein